jgi:hypothetical protein
MVKTSVKTRNMDQVDKYLELAKSYDIEYFYKRIFDMVWEVQH